MIQGINKKPIKKKKKKNVRSQLTSTTTWGWGTLEKIKGEEGGMVLAYWFVTLSTPPIYYPQIKGFILREKKKSR